MSQRTRIWVALVVLAVVVGGMLGIEALRRSAAETIELPAGSIPVVLDDKVKGGFQPADLERLEKVSFVDAEEGKTQDGWLLRDVILLYVDEGKLKPDHRVVVSSSTREKSADLTWAEVAEPANMVMFDLSNRGALKLVSLLEKLDTRDEWVQNIDRIEVTSP